MRDFENLLKADIELEERMLKMIQRELRALPGGRLKLGRGGKAIYFKPEKSGLGEKAQFLPPGSRLAKGIARRIYLEKQQRIIENNLKLQKVLVGKYTPYSYHQVLQRLSPVYRLVDVSARQEVESQREKGPNETMHPETLKHSTLKRELRRSKSETIISMLYDSYRIPYEYEIRIYWPEDAPPEAWEVKKNLGIRDYYVADFAFRFPDGSWKYQEHVGLMKDPKYMEELMKKLTLYYWAGVTPGNNLILTSDDRYGCINQQEIVTIIESQLAPLIGTAQK